MQEANITWLTENVATGGALSSSRGKQQRQFRELRSMGIDLVIDCRIEDSDFSLWNAAPETQYLYLPINDPGHKSYHVPAAHFDAAVTRSRAVLADGGKVFAHCYMGINRGPSTAMAILMDQGMTPEDAFDLIRAKRPQAGIVFDEDAIRAHYARHNWQQTSITKRLKKYRAHRDAVFTKEMRAEIPHLIQEFKE